ncbi:hypothetical protein F5887DRAFT_916208 [Amanita rubescens]|nr:hypothetical protein F5887DRAFT_916208 [Amanita rubescens]
MAVEPSHYPHTLPVSFAETYQKHFERSRVIREKVLLEMDPRPLTKAEINAIHNDTLHRIHHINELQAVIDTHRPRHDSEIYEHLYDARVEFWFRFYRTFRINDLPVEVLVNIFRFVAWASVTPPMSIAARLTLTSGRVDILGCPDHRSSKTILLMVPTMADLLDKLFVKIGQIRILLLILNGREATQIALEKFRLFGAQKCPLALQRLELHCYNKDPFPEHPVDNQFPPLFGGASVPTLKYISLTGVYLDWKKSLLTNLTILDIRSVPFSQAPDLLHFRAMLANSPNLWKLCLHNGGPQWDGKCPALMPISLPNLKVLVLAGFTVSYATYLIYQITAPNVRDLTLGNLVGEDYTPLYRNITMKARFPHIRILTFYSSEVVPDQWMVRWLTSMPELVYLRLLNVQPLFLYFFLNRADPPLRRQGIDKKLCTATDSFLDLQLVDPDAIIGWITHRQRLGRPIRKIYISEQMSDKMTVQHYKSMRELAPIFRLEYGAKTEEEDILQR